MRRPEIVLANAALKSAGDGLYFSIKISNSGKAKARLVHLDNVGLDWNPGLVSLCPASPAGLIRQLVCLRKSYRQASRANSSPSSAACESSRAARPLHIVGTLTSAPEVESILHCSTFAYSTSGDRAAGKAAGKGIDPLALELDERFTSGDEGALTEPLKNSLRVLNVPNEAIMRKIIRKHAMKDRPGAWALRFDSRRDAPFRASAVAVRRPYL